MTTCVNPVAKGCNVGCGNSAATERTMTTSRRRPEDLYVPSNSTVAYDADRTLHSSTTVASANAQEALMFWATFERSSAKLRHIFRAHPYYRRILHPLCNKRDEYPEYVIDRARALRDCTVCARRRRQMEATEGPIGVEGEQ
mgnify:CR=1 FL=1